MALSVFTQDAEKVVQQQLEAYNLRNIEAFMAVFHPEIEIYSLGENTPSISGLDKVKETYLELFEKSPELHSIVINRSVIGDRVIDYERISGRKGSKDDLFIVMIYEVKDGKIRRAWALRE